MAFKNETPLRGWKEILPLLGVYDDRTARNILREKNLLQYECGRPVLLASEYLATLTQQKK